MLILNFFSRSGDSFLIEELEVFDPLNTKILQSLLKYLRHPNVQDFNTLNTR